MSQGEGLARRELARALDRLVRQTYSAGSADGLVAVTVDGLGRIRSIGLDPWALDRLDGGALSERLVEAYVASREQGRKIVHDIVAHDLGIETAALDRLRRGLPPYLDRLPPTVATASDDTGTCRATVDSGGDLLRLEVSRTARVLDAATLGNRAREAMTLAQDEAVHRFAAAMERAGGAVGA